jgi:predicted nucleotidyltransferase
MQSYILGARNREKTRLAQLKERQNQGLEIAKQAAKLLRQEFGATRVILFGSMLNPHIHQSSDIDLAVWNLPKSDYFQAVCKLQGLSEFAIDLIEPDKAPAYIIEAI